MTDSRSLLLAAAVEAFAKYGLRGTRVQNITQKAGVNERMIYHHFGSKERLYEEAIRDQQQRLFTAWKPALKHATTLPPYEGMRAALMSFVDALSASPLLVKLWMHESLGGWQTLPLPDTDTPVPEMRAIYERGQQEGVFRQDCPFFVMYTTAMSALIAMPILSGRDAKIIANASPKPDQTEILGMVIDQLIDGMSGPLPPR
ncbi:AcrR family transcriptional regulator [Kibdelosporangium banguiense]|uniref:AcrR family transcriptional regulator n=1 Tax=Kibdelosporangium banguiense TaxID=1365924 RepID=A0ABS4TWD3_9PSEU|nr:TetR/AcrR family transcriptional regulator [Kibdelosporangium banguiense]MBP2328678.1 AcrR family transcriptional regulator [Kibdelosporangium banguiense]